MSFFINEKIYNITLISKVKRQTDPKKIKKKIKNLKNCTKEDLKKFSELKIKIFEKEKEELKKSEFKIAVPIIGFHHYLEDIKKSNLKQTVNNNDENKVESSSSTANESEEEVKQIDSSDFSEDE